MTDARRRARPPAARTHWIRDPAAIEALASPARQALLDRLEALGPSSVAELAASLGVAPDALYYHVKLLQEAGVLVGVGERATARRDETVYDVVRRHWHIRYEPDDPANARAVGRVAASLLRQAERDFRAGLADPAAVVSGPGRNLWSLRLEAALTPREVETLNGHLQAIVDLLRKPRRDAEAGTLCAVSWVVAPIGAARGARRRTRQDRKPRKDDQDRKSPRRTRP